MKVYFVQSGFKDEGGHHLLETRAWREAVQAAGLTWRGFAGLQLEVDLARRCDVVPLFPFAPLAEVDPDPLSREITDLLYLSEQFANAALLMDGVAAEDLVMVEFATAKEIYGLARWLRQIDVSRRPYVAILVHVPDAEWRSDAQRASFSGRATTWRFAINQLRVSLPDHKINVSAIDARLAQLLGQALNLPITLTPLVSWFDDTVPLASDPPAFDLLFAGDSRIDKGSDMTIENLRALAASQRPLRIGVQVANQVILEQLRRCVAERPDFSIDVAVGPLPAERYIQRLRSTRLVVLPYLAAHYAIRGSGVAAEAFGYGIPVVAPADTWISDRLAEGVGAGATFDQLDPGQLAKACCRALDHYPALHLAAVRAAALWRSQNSAAQALARLRQQLKI